MSESTALKRAKKDKREGKVAGGYIAQVTNLGAVHTPRARSGAHVRGRVHPYARRRLHGKRTDAPLQEVRNVLSGAVRYGLSRPPLRGLMLANVFTAGVSIFAFYAMQPYLLQLYGDPNAYGIAGLAAAIVGAAQIGGAC